VSVGKLQLHAQPTFLNHDATGYVDSQL